MYVQQCYACKRRTHRSQYGLGTAAPVKELKDVFDGSLSLIWADSTNGTASPSPGDIITHITSGFSDRQLSAVRKVESPDDIPSACPQNFNLFSECYGAVAFNSFPTTNANDPRPINYTLRADGGLFHIDVTKHTSDYELRILPLQWAIDRAIVELRTGQRLPTPLEWPFTQETNDEQFTQIRLSKHTVSWLQIDLCSFACRLHQGTANAPRLGAVSDTENEVPLFVLTS